MKENKKESIIEKLGITPIRSVSMFKGQSDCDICKAEDVKEIEDDRNKLLKALISAVFALEKNGFPCLDIEISVIEKVAEKSWEEVKRLIR